VPAAEVLNLKTRKIAGLLQAAFDFSLGYGVGGREEILLLFHVTKNKCPARGRGNDFATPAGNASRAYLYWTFPKHYRLAMLARSLVGRRRT
jgi:hypothetical protein